MRRALARRRTKRHLEGLAYRVLRACVRPRPRPARQPPRRVLLLLRGQRRGDAVVALPFSAEAKRLFPGAEIHAAGPEALRAVLAHDACLSAFHALPHPEWRSPRPALRALRRLRGLDFDLVFVLGIQAASALVGRRLGRHAVGYDYNGRGFALDHALAPHLFCNRSGWEYGPETRPPHIAEFWLGLLAPFASTRPGVLWDGLDLRSEQPAARAFLADATVGTGPLVAFHPYAADANRCWPEPLARRFLERLVAETDWRVVLTGAAADRPAAQRLARDLTGRVAVAAGRLDLGTSWALLAEADLLVSIDTSLVHMAAAAGTPIVALLGPSDPLVWGPHGQADAVLQANAWCQRCKRPSCLHPGVPCMAALDPELVLAHARRRIRRAPVATSGS